MDLSEYNCGICGFAFETPTWDEYGCASFDICLCCGAEFGLDDIDIHEINSYRTSWLESGMKWFCIEYKPEKWDWEAQFQQIDPKYVQYKY